MIVYLYRLIREDHIEGVTESYQIGKTMGSTDQETAKTQAEAALRKYVEEDYFLKMLLKPDELGENYKEFEKRASEVDDIANELTDEKALLVIGFINENYFETSYYSAYIEPEVLEMEDCVPRWHSVEEEGAPKKSGWYCVTIHDSEWMSDDTTIPEKDRLRPSEDFAGMAYCRVNADGFSWEHVNKFDGDGEYVSSFKNTFCIEQKDGNESISWDSHIVAWAPIELLSRPYTTIETR